MKKNNMLLYIFSLTLLSLILFLFTLSKYGLASFTTLLLWCILIIITDSLVIELPNGVGVSVGLAITIAAIFTSGPFVGALTAACGVSFKIVKNNTGYSHIFNTPYYKTLFNASQLFISSSITGIVFTTLGGTVGDQNFIFSLPPILFSLLCYVVLNSSFIAALLFIMSGESFFKLWFKNLKGLLPNTAGVGTIGVIIALAYISYGVGAVLLFFGPLLLSRYSYKLYVELRQTYMETINALNKSMDAKDAYTSGHATRVQKYAMMLGQAAKLSSKQLDNLKTASVLHDIGKIGIDDSILNKPGKLTDQEFSTIHKHPIIGYDILRNVDFLKDIAVIIKYHHERYDGKGYPDQISGSEIPVESSIIAIADTFDAITSDRPYRKKLTKEFALKEIANNAGRQFEPALAKTFVEIVTNYNEDEESRHVS